MGLALMAITDLDSPFSCSRRTSTSGYSNFPLRTPSGRMDRVLTRTTVLDPVDDIRQAIEAVYYNLQEDGVKVVVFRRPCSTYEEKGEGADRRLTAVVDTQKCIGEACGCERFCTRVLACPAIQHDEQNDKAFVHSHLCNGCGLCCQLCPREAISLADAGVETYQGESC